MSAMEIAMKGIAESILPYVGVIKEIEDEDVTVIDGGEHKRMSDRIGDIIKALMEDKE